MSSLECRKTFLEVVPSSNWMPAAKRTQSLPVGNLLQEDEADTTADRILRRASCSFQWRSDWPEGISRGSYGHPSLCRAPCVYAFYGTCMKGPRCNFCHLEHSSPKRKLTRQERQALYQMPESLVLLIFNSHLDKHVTKLQLQQPLRLVLAVVARRVRLLRPQWPTGFEFRMALDQLWNLRSFSLGRLVDCILQCPQVDASFRPVVKSLFDSIRKDMNK